MSGGLRNSERNPDPAQARAPRGEKGPNSIGKLVKSQSETIFPEIIEGQDGANHVSARHVVPDLNIDTLRV
ncbi:hypothetical protein GGD64_005778 [Bradyrhizobium sp. CIR3A]|uniref:hypothetical protein n=1 Tax=Bradyrhizobium sp. IAR9 TaxID=2663841 RepID=UPI0015CCD25D|nr:hypothetical protein [Bradyrhizobium sp. IAR9]MBB4261727.1 hypothetical protein [Bradyrhizobium sp. CIR3A]NYG43835.1 hypothetical protein [Bradyrhizobium sp. IAR9]